MTAIFTPSNFQSVYQLAIGLNLSLSIFSQLRTPVQSSLATEIERKTVGWMETVREGREHYGKARTAAAEGNPEARLEDLTWPSMKQDLKIEALASFLQLDILDIRRDFTKAVEGWISRDRILAGLSIAALPASFYAFYLATIRDPITMQGQEAVDAMKSVYVATSLPLFFPLGLSLLYAAWASFKLSRFRRQLRRLGDMEFDLRFTLPEPARKGPRSWDPDAWVEIPT